jgi:hypothetical protein
MTEHRQNIKDTEHQNIKDTEHQGQETSRDIKDRQKHLDVGDVAG